MVPPFFACKSLWPVSVRKARKMHVSVWIFFMECFFAKKGRTAKGVHIPNPCKIQREVGFLQALFPVLFILSFCYFFRMR